MNADWKMESWPVTPKMEIDLGDVKISTDSLDKDAIFRIVALHEARVIVLAARASYGSRSLGSTEREIYDLADGGLEWLMTQERLEPPESVQAARVRNEQDKKPKTHSEYLGTGHDDEGAAPRRRKAG